MDKIKPLRIPFSPPCPGRTKLSSRRWNKARTRMLNRRRQDAATRDVSLCEHCEMEGKAFRFQRVEGHHKIPRRQRPDLTYEASNVQFLCKRHHSYVTKLEQTEKAPGVVVVCGPDARVYARQNVPLATPVVHCTDESLDQVEGPVWIIAEKPTSAYIIAIRLGARVVETWT